MGTVVDVVKTVLPCSKGANLDTIGRNRILGSRDLGGLPTSPAPGAPIITLGRRDPSGPLKLWKLIAFSRKRVPFGAFTSDVKLMSKMSYALLIERNKNNGK